MASLADLVGLTRAREGANELASRQKGRVMGLPGSVGAGELRMRLADMDSHNKIMNPRLAALTGAGMGALGGAIIAPGLGLGRGVGALAGAVGGAVGAPAGSELGGAITDATVRPYLERRIAEKEALGSVAEYSVLFDKIADGDLGDTAREALIGICESIDETVSSDNLSEKTASVYDVSNDFESDVRKDRLDQLLRR